MAVEVEPIHAQRTGEMVASHIRRQVVSGQLDAGERLPPEDELAESFGVARTSMREALRILESQGLVTIKRGRGGGAVVTHPQVQHLARAFALSLQLAGATVADVHEARLIIEPQLARRWALQHSSADMEALITAADLVATTVDAGDVGRFALAGADFHHVLLDRSGNVTLRTIGSLLHELVQLTFTRASTSTDTDKMQRTVRSYRRLIRLIQSGDSEGAEAHWRRQLRYTMEMADHDDLTDLLDS